MRSTLALLLLFGPAIVAATTCQLYTLPTTGECTIDIEWRVHDNKQALATCLEYFPTTFVKGVQSGNQVKCTVKAAYTCVDANHFLMYDKCYYFSPTPSKINKQKISEYVKMDATTKRSAQCAGGKLAAVYSSTHAKFLGMEANRRGIDKLGIGMTTDGMTIDEENGKKSMLHKKMWKLIEGDYWEGDKLVKLEKGDKPDYVYPSTANYLFMRTLTDHMYNRIQGSFERATADVEVTFACEVPAVFTEQQSWYCDKLGSNGLGLDTVYVQEDGPNTARCLYVTASKYTFKGTYEDMANIKGCQERPSSLHSTSLDDGTATYTEYAKFRNKGKLRLAGYKDSSSYTRSDSGYFDQIRCQPQPNQYNLEKARQQWKYLKHNGYVQHSPASAIAWEEKSEKDKYPKNECSDFPKDSITTIGLRNGFKIDMPSEVRAPAVCSMIFFQSCEHHMAVHKKSLCGDKLTPRDRKPAVECKSEKKYQPTTKDFYSCACPEGHEPTLTNGVASDCKWKSDLDKYCGWMRFGPNGRTIFAGKDEQRDLQLRGAWTEDLPSFHARNTVNDLYEFSMDRIAVRDGCELTVWGAAFEDKPNFMLVDKARYGTHHVPNSADHSLAGATHGMGASSIWCMCPNL